VTALAALAVGLGAALQSAVGFGFALVCAPLLFAALGPAEAVWSLNALALVVNAITLLGERRRPQPLGRIAVTVLIWSLPGMVAGALVLQHADRVWLQAALTVSVFAALALRRATIHLPAPVAGLSSGVLTTSLSTAGPPVVLLLLGRGHAPARVRDTLSTVFIAQGALGLLVLALTDTKGVPDAGLLVFAAAAVLGQLGGRPLFGRLAERGYERVLTGVLVLSAAIGLAAVLL
jgi:uncharacterized membrane protein YfcA